MQFQKDHKNPKKKSQESAANSLRKIPEKLQQGANAGAHSRPGGTS
jgi:hypothetical protein